MRDDKKETMLRMARFDSDSDNGRNDDSESAPRAFHLVPAEVLAPQYELEHEEILLPTSFEIALVPGPDLYQ